jgi:hypothetical protein
VSCSARRVAQDAYALISILVFQPPHEAEKASAGRRTSGDPAELVAEQVRARLGSAATASLGLASGRTGALRLATGAACTHGALRFRLTGGLRPLLHNPSHCFLSFSLSQFSHCPKRTNHKDLRRVKM